MESLADVALLGPGDGCMPQLCQTEPSKILNNPVRFDVPSMKDGTAISGTFIQQSGTGETKSVEIIHGDHAFVDVDGAGPLSYHHPT